LSFQLVKMRQNKQKAQVWLETVIYTLIGLSIITILLAVVLPQIKEKKDKIIIEQSVSVLRAIDSEIEELIYRGPGNIKDYEIKISKGKFIINSDNEIENMSFEIESDYEYSEIDVPVSSSGIDILTIKKGRKYLVTLSIGYKDKVDLSWSEEDIKKTLQESASAYNLMIGNKGKTNNLINIDFGLS